MPTVPFKHETMKWPDVAGWVLSATQKELKWGLDVGGVSGSGLLGQREKLGFDIVTEMAPADTTGSSGAGIPFWVLRLGQGGWPLCPYCGQSLDQGYSGKQTWLWVQCLFRWRQSSEGDSPVSCQWQAASAAERMSTILKGGSGQCWAASVTSPVIEWLRCVSCFVRHFIWGFTNSCSNLQKEVMSSLS